MALIAGIAAAALSGLASARTQPTLSVARSVSVGTGIENVVVNSGGLTVYTLSGETVHHLKCTKANGCFSFWFPVKVHSATSRLTAAHGIGGKLGELRRNGFEQLTLGGHPVYTFLGDARHKGSAKGDGLVSFHGTWHVLAVSNGAASTAPTTTTTSTTTTSTTTTSTTTTSTTTAPYYPYVHGG